MVEMPSADRLGQCDMSDHLAWFEHGFLLGPVAPQAMEVGNRDRPRRAIALDRLHCRIEHAHGDRHVAGIGRDAGIRNADHPKLARITANRRAPVARLALVAGQVGIVEIGAARALEQIATGRGLVAQLAAGPRLYRAGQHSIIAAHPRIGGERGIGNQRPDPQPALLRRVSILSSPVSCTSTRCARRLDLQLHQVEQVGAAGYELGPGRRRHGRRSLAPALAGALVGKAAHRPQPSATCAIASAMFE